MMETGAEERKYKVIVIGNAGVGKTALTYRFSEGKYRDNLRVTIGVDLRVKKVKVDDEYITLNIWDTAGLEKNRQSFTTHYYRNVQAIILVYDLTNQKSFDDLFIWLQEVQTHSEDDAIKVLIGNKCDGDVVVNRQKAQQFADTFGMPLFETSAKLDSEMDNIEGIFQTIAHKLKANSNLTVNPGAIQLLEGVRPAASSSSGCNC